MAEIVLCRIDSRFDSWSGNDKVGKSITGKQNRCGK